MSEACARIVQRDDPHLYATALFTPEPAREHLTVLYAFDIELSRATRASAESLIARIRLQWWRDVIEEAEAGKSSRAHEVAGPLAVIISQNIVDPVDLESMAQAREMELDLPFSDESFATWHKLRFNHLVAAASTILTRPAPQDGTRDPPSVSFAMSAAFVLRHAVARARRAELPMIPGTDGDDLSALARGELTEGFERRARALATEGLDELSRARAERDNYDPRIVAALLPLARAERTLRLVRRDPAAVLRQLDDIDRPFDGLRLAWRAATGRW